MENRHDFGKQLVVRESKKSKSVWLIIGAVASLVLLSAGGLFFLMDPHFPEDTYMGIALLVLAVILFGLLLFLSRKLRAKVEIYEQGVVVARGSKEHKFHFSEIAGLRDAPGDSGVFVVPMAGGLVGAIVAGAVAGVAGNMSDSRRRRHRLRSISIVTKGDSPREIGVVNTGGDELSEVYTDWLIAQTPITKENVHNLTLSFGGILELNNGVFVHHRRRGDVQLALKDVTDLSAGEDSVMFYGLNEKGKSKCLIDVKVAHIVNIDLLFSILHIAAGDEAEQTEEAE